MFLDLLQLLITPDNGMGETVVILIFYNCNLFFRQEHLFRQYTLVSFHSSHAPPVSWELGVEGTPYESFFLPSFSAYLVHSIPCPG